MKKMIIIVIAILTFTFLIACTNEVQKSTITTTDGPSSSESVSLPTSTIDNVAPLISYQGSLGLNPTIDVGIDIDFMEGMVGLDNIEGIITERILVSVPNYVKNKPGIYYASYALTDVDGNSAETFQRIYTVLGTTEEDTISQGKINNINGTRNANYIVYYTYENKGSRTGANQWGLEVSINADGVVIEVDTNITMVAGGYALSGVGTGRTTLADVRVGDNVSIDLAAMTFVITRDEYKSSLFNANLAIEKATTLKEEAYQAGYDFDLDAVNSILSSAQEKYLQLVSAQGSSSQISTFLKEVNALCDKVTYMASYVKSIESRAVWHRPGATSFEGNTQYLTSLIARFKRLGFNTIYLETYWNGYASYRSDILETHPRVENYKYSEYDDDYVKAFITEANKQNIDVHAWCHTFNAGSVNIKSSVVKDEWLAEDYQGNLLHPNIYGGVYFYDPSNEDVISFLESVFVEMATKYNFKGIQYDYIRYYDNDFSQNPIRDSGYGEKSETLFKEEYKLQGDLRELVLNGTYRQMWNEWRMNNITKAVERFTKALRSAREDIIISAAVVSSLSSARSTYMQDWLTWVNAGYIDILCPMIYTGSALNVENSTNTIITQMDSKSFLVSGISPTYSGYTVMCNHNEILATIKANGSAIFASQSVIGNLELEESLQIGLYKNDAISPFDDPKEVVKFAVESLLDEIDRIYLSRELITVNQANYLKQSLNLILGNDCLNPSDYQDILNIISNISITEFNDLIEETINNKLNNLYSILNIQISRYLFVHELWDGTGTRPNPTLFNYEKGE